VCTATLTAFLPEPLVAIRVSQLAQLWRTTLLTWCRGPFVPLSTTVNHESVQPAQFIAAGIAVLTAAGAGMRLASSSAPFSEAIALKPKFESTRADAAVKTREKRVNVFIFCLSIFFSISSWAFARIHQTPRLDFILRNTQGIWKRFLACF
jgi:hypothetical protein